MNNNVKSFQFYKKWLIKFERN